MAPADIIKYVYRNYPKYWKNRQLSHAAFAEMLQRHMGLPLLSATDFSRMVNEKVPRKLVEVLKNLAVLESIEKHLDCPSLFACEDEQQIDCLLAPKTLSLVQYDPTSQQTYLVPYRKGEEQFQLSTREDRVAKHLMALLLQGKGNVLCWTDPPPVGAAFLAYTVATSYLPRAGITSTFLLNPFPDQSRLYLQDADSGDQPANFDSGLHEVASKLGITGRFTASALLKELKATRAVLFILQAEALVTPEQPGTTDLQDLLREARRGTAPGSNDPVPIVLIGRPSADRLFKKVQLMGDQRNELAFGSKMTERYEFFETQWKRFSDLRRKGDQSAVGDSQSAVGDSRLKRAHQYYTADGGTSMWPSHLRMLAFLASNDATLSYFDPTAGWDRIAGMDIEKLPVDIQLHLAEAVQLARTIPEDHKRQTLLRAVRWCSTAVYWLTEDAAEDLGRLTPKTKIESFRSAVEELDRVIDVVGRDGGQQPVYKMDIAVRAVIQQRWGAKDPFTRAYSHYQVAQRLYLLRDDKELLNIEFPVEPHWGRSRMHFLAECLRHLVRACDYSDMSALSDEQRTEEDGDFPDSPARAIKGCDPRQVINFCFGEIYWKELNGNAGGGTIHTRKLALQHGAYQLTAELLQLMSCDQVLGQPHPALDRAFIPRYLREVGYALLDLGELRKARSTFERLIDFSSRDGADVAETVQYQLDLMVVQSAMGDLARARQGLAEVRSLAASRPAPDSNWKSRKADKTIDTRLDAREADLLYLEGNLSGALEAYERIEKTSPSSISRDVAHVYIATLGALSDDKGREYLERAMSLCVRNLFDSTSRGLHHVGLGFRVALAHCFRKQGLLNVAEVTLDQVYKDVLQYGCSERTYLAMLLEAGRTVLNQGRPARAYAAYLRPCLDRASSRGHARIAAAAHKYARECLLQLVSEFKAGAQFSTDVLLKQLEGQGEYLKRGNPTMIDPKSSYDVISIDQWVSRLSSEKALKLELNQLG